MSNVIEYMDKIAFHPGYYIKEIIEEYDCTQEDFAKRLGTTPKNLSYLVRGEQSVSRDIAIKLSRMIGTSVELWLNLQKEYDVVIAEIEAEQELDKEREVFRHIDDTFFMKHPGFAEQSEKTDDLIARIRYYLRLGSLDVLRAQDMTVNFRSGKNMFDEEGIVNTNIMIQIGANAAMDMESPDFDRKKFNMVIHEIVEYANDEVVPFNVIREKLLEAGVVLVVVPNLKRTEVSGATRRVGKKVLLVINEEKMYSDTFWFTLYREICHIINGDYGLSIEGANDISDDYARNILIEPHEYEKFMKNGDFSEAAIERFAADIKRTPAIVYGILKQDNHISEYDKNIATHITADDALSEANRYATSTDRRLTHDEVFGSLRKAIKG